ncbi:hypothetical protein LWI29_031520 [Acer saccharum]|uniref:Uncharacterized protein n=1 Tax=Acer saccharum TaxID=4024 RepID=A0AA39UXE3_ACESA|nr:hypothetical protein LWI29_031520 [Acer saccharum]
MLGFVVGMAMLIGVLRELCWCCGCYCLSMVHWFTCYQQLRSVVLALGGFHRLHLLYLWQLSKHPGLGSDWASFSPMIANGSKSSITRGGLQIHDTQSLASYQKQRSRDKREELYLGLKKFDPLLEYKFQRKQFSEGGWIVEFPLDI